MKNIFLFSLLAKTFILYAAPVGNTMAPALIQEGFVIPCDSWVDLRIGYEGDFVGDGRMEQIEQGSGRVDTFQQYTNSATFTFNALDRVDLFGILGSSRVCADWRYDLSEAITRIQIETLYHFLWGIGGRVLLFEWEKMGLGFGGRYSYCHYRPSWLTTNAVPISTEGARVTWRQWQIDLSLSYQIDLFTPYLGVKYSNETVKLGIFSVPVSSSGLGINHFENKNPVGIYIGCSISNCKYFMLNIEGRLIDEDAVTISGDLRF
ncbi:MAG TPA: hypothetical protein VLE95_01135 [Chlamydiales bacterium]|nr:hypothetical protein [Chlamydiales bacterium]